MGVEEALTQRSVALLAAHPDDETVGAGGLMPRMRVSALIHVTDGAPRSHPDRERYAQTRREELQKAVGQAGSPLGPPVLGLDVSDQEASLDMPALTRRLSELLAGLRPSIVLTHPYEGGHPDHDAAAFAAHAACASMPAPPDLY